MQTHTLHYSLSTGMVSHTIIQHFHRNTAVFRVAVTAGGLPEPLPAGSQLSLTVKPTLQHTADPLLLVEGLTLVEGTPATYDLTCLADNAALTAYIPAQTAEVALTAQLQLTRPSQPICVSSPFELTLVPAYALGDSDLAPPPPADSALTARALRHDQPQSLTLEARLQALANLGITLTNDDLTILCPDGAARRLILAV